MLRVLVVEDEILVQMGLICFLEALGHQVCGGAANAADAVALAEEQRPDLVLMDIRLAADGDGVTVAQEIRDRCDIPSVFISANLDNATVARARRARPLAFIHKPFDPGDLQRVLEGADAPRS
ncbi:response regulator [Arenibaculum pallidiluteum]|uniref:response regulator n=1 Tax=Arenibaculum pallidiluteum TaxID=2812559 RepID=UPI001F447F7E|nr:response regulator [Arenibaculum pallidiluteum]